MAFVRPNLETIIDRIKGDLKAALGITTILRRSFLDAMAKALAGVTHSLHGHLVFVSRQLFPDQAEAEFLVRWASIYNVQRKAATFPTLQISGTGVETTVITSGTLFKRSDGVEYATDSEVTIAAGVYTVEITAIDSGAGGNIDDGQTVSLSSPFAGVDSQAVVDSTVTEGENEETDENLRIRLVNRIQAPPAGGTATDFISFALSVAGITRAWVFPGHLGEGTVGVSFVEDDQINIIPSPAKVAEVQAVLDLEGPISADKIAFAPAAKTVDLTINLKPNTSVVRDAVTLELKDLFAREAQVAGAYKGVGLTHSGILNLSKLNEAISVANGEEDHGLELPTADIIPVVGEIAVLGTITFQTLT